MLDRFVVFLAQGYRQQLIALAGERGTSASELARTILYSWLDQQKEKAQ